MVIKYLGPLVLALVVGQAGCTIHRPLDFNSEKLPKKVEFRTGAGAMYTATREDIEAYLAEAVKTAKNEDALVHIKKKDGRELVIDAGMDERPDAVKMSLQLVINYTGAGDVVTAYHPHFSPEPPMDKDFRTHAHLQREVEKVGGRCDASYVVAKGLLDGRIHLVEFFGSENNEGVTGRYRACDFVSLKGAPSKVAAQHGSGTLYAAGRPAGEKDFLEAVENGDISGAEVMMYIDRVVGQPFWIDIGKDETGESVKVDELLALRHTRKGDSVKVYYLSPEYIEPKPKDYHNHAMLQKLFGDEGVAIRKSVLVVPGGIHEYQGALNESLITGTSVKIAKKDLDTHPRD